MITHEKHCTMNPNRECRMCDKGAGGHGHTIAELMELLPHPDIELTLPPTTITDIRKLSEYRSAFELLVEDSMPKLREAAENCPMCILAALRQRKIEVWSVKSFDYTKECKSIFDDWNAENGHQNY